MDGELVATVGGRVLDSVGGRVGDLAKFFYTSPNFTLNAFPQILAALILGGLLLLYIALINPMGFWGSMMDAMHEASSGGYGQTTYYGQESYTAPAATGYGEEYGSARSDQGVDLSAEQRSLYTDLSLPSLQTSESGSALLPLISLHQALPEAASQISFSH